MEYQTGVKIGESQLLNLKKDLSFYFLISSEIRGKNSLQFCLNQKLRETQDSLSLLHE